MGFGASLSLQRAVAAEVPYLRRFARALTGDATSADDLVQACVERALTRLHLFDEDRALRTWLFTILRNLYVNELRQKKRRGPHINTGDTSESELSRSPEQLNRLAVIDVARALDELPDEQREVLILISVDEMSYKEIADVIGSPIGTVMSRLSRARNRLKVLMDGEAPNLRRVK